LTKERDTNGLGALQKDLSSGAVDTLVLLDVNLAYAASGRFDFEQLLPKAKHIVHVGLYDDESARLAEWHLPLAHFLEAWDDARAYDGTASIVQPLIAPLHDGRSVIEMLAAIESGARKKGHDLVQETWRASGALSSEKAWRKALHDGVVAGSAFAASSAKSSDVAGAIAKLSKKTNAQPSTDKVEVIFANDYTVLDGRYASLSWMKELPDPITKMAWDNALHVGPKLAKELGIKSRVNKRLYEADLVDLTVDGKTLQLPTFVMPGLADYSVVAFLGYGRRNAGIIGSSIGVDVYPLLPADGSRVAQGGVLSRTGETVNLATTQEQFAMNGDSIQEIDVLSLQRRDPARDTNAADYQRDPGYVKKKGLPGNLLKMQPNGKTLPLQVTKSWEYEGNKWGMVIDLTSCIGCNSCVTACQSENNIPIVGREQVMRSRMMHWIRVDRYFTGDVQNPTSVAQPVGCMHCENAPCEPVCPVAATAHDKEGLNVMAYNRCIGTRYCANNCPYKVRKFNYFDFSHSGNVYVDPVNKERSQLLRMQANPDVTIRYRGVMEKCTYCTQRIQEAKMDARRKGENPESLADGKVTPACAQSCPTQAITFGNLNDPNSRVSILKEVDRKYDLLEELNTRPRTSYLAKVRNPNPELSLS